MGLGLVNRQVASTGTAGVDGLTEGREFAVGSDGVRKDLSVLFNVFGASVNDIETGVVTRKGGVDDLEGIALNVEEDETAVRGVEAIDVQRVLGLRAARAVSEFVKVAAMLKEEVSESSRGNEHRSKLRKKRTHL